MDTFYRPSMRSHWNTQKRWAEGSEICTELMKGWYSPKQSQTNTDNLLRKNWTSTKSLLGHLHCSCLSRIISSIKICHNKTIFKTTRVIRTKLRSRISQQWLFLVLCHYCDSKQNRTEKYFAMDVPSLADQNSFDFCSIFQQMGQFLW